MLFHLIIENLTLKVIIGILDFEREIPQEITIDAEISYEYNDGDFLDYMKIKNTIAKLLEDKQYRLLEEALLEITQHLKNTFNAIKTIELKIKKLNITPDCIIGVKINKSF